MSKHVEATGYRMPAEWQEHAATWLAWPHNEEDFPGKLQAVEWVFTEIARQLSRGERVRFLVKSKAAEARARHMLQQSAVDLGAIDFHIAETNRSWTRDYMPLFTKASDSAALRAVKFRFNAWARYEDHALDEAAGMHVAGVASEDVVTPTYSVNGEPRRVVLEGGAVDVDGEGTALVTRQCLLETQYVRNPGASAADVSEWFQQHLGASRTLWIGDGIAGDDTSGHIDDVARFVRPGVVVVCSAEAASPDFRALEVAKAELRAAKDAQGRTLEVIELPMPDPVFLNGEVLPASYANFYIGNECVLVPTFNAAQDRVALGTLAELFPTRRVVGIHALDLVSGLGTIHCSTMQEPRA